MRSVNSIVLSIAFFSLSLTLGACSSSSNNGADASGSKTDGASKADGAVKADAAVDANTPDGAVDTAPADGPAADAGEAGPKVTCGPVADGGMPPDALAMPSAMTTFFVSSQKNMTGDLGGLTGADMRCQTLAASVGLGSKTWHAYLSVEHDAANGNMPTNAKDRIGHGPWYNSRGGLVAADLASLHMRTGDPAVFIDEHGNLINGQWTGSPTPNEHDILTGSNADGTLAVGKTCLDWTSTMMMPDGGVPDGGEAFVARVGHADGFGPNCSQATTPNNLPSWNSAHDNRGCNNTAPAGGAGRIYCFAIN
jgi:hypothetical protein